MDGITGYEEYLFDIFLQKEKITLQDVTLHPNLVDIKDILKVIIYENQKSMQNMQKEFDKSIVDKNEQMKNYLWKLRNLINIRSEWKTKYNKLLKRTYHQNL